MEKTRRSRAKAAVSSPGEPTATPRSPLAMRIDTPAATASGRAAFAGNDAARPPMAPPPVAAPSGDAAVSLAYLFFTFLKLGATAFGGYMSLVAMVQKQLVEIDKRLKEETLLDAVSLTSVLPGPVAVNVIVYIGYRMRGIAGAALAFTGIILPSFLLVAGLSRLYFSYGNVPAVQALFRGITPAVTALILTVALGMARKTMKWPSQWAIGIVSALLLAAFGGFALTFGLIAASGIAGYLLFRPQRQLSPAVSTGDRTNAVQATVEHPAEPAVAPPAGTRRKASLSRWAAYGSGLLVLPAAGWLLWKAAQGEAPLALQIVSVFAGCSLTLFGGGYVVIPALHELFVENLHWLAASEFADGIAIGQVTPGPIFITAAFIGYKVAGWGGALLATLAMFAPPAALTVLASRFMGWLDGSSAVKAAMKGVRAAVIGLIFASAFTIGQTMDYSAASVVLFLFCAAVSWKYAVSPVYLILGAAAAGFFFF